MMKTARALPGLIWQAVFRDAWAPTRLCPFGERHLLHHVIDRLAPQISTLALNATGEWARPLTCLSCQIPRWVMQDLLPAFSQACSTSKTTHLARATCWRRLRTARFFRTTLLRSFWITCRTRTPSSSPHPRDRFIPSLLSGRLLSSRIWRTLARGGRQPSHPQLSGAPPHNRRVLSTNGKRHQFHRSVFQHQHPGRAVAGANLPEESYSMTRQKYLAFPAEKTRARLGWQCASSRSSRARLPGLHHQACPS